MANLNDLPLNEDTIDDVDPETVPLFGGGMALPPQPGQYLVRLPSGEALLNCFEVEETPDQGQRLRAVFRAESALWNLTLNEPYEGRVSNRVRSLQVNDPENPGKKKTIFISDMAQLLRVIHQPLEREDPDDPASPPIKNNRAYANALCRGADSTFLIEHSVTARCDETRDIYKGGSTIKGKKGCGQRWAVESYTPKNGGKPVSAIPKDADGRVQLKFTCRCGADLRCWGQIRGFKVHKPSPSK